MTVIGNKRSTEPNEDPFVKNTCVYSISSCMILILVFFIALPGALMPYISRIRFIRQIPKVEDNSTEEPLAAARPLIMCQVNPMSFTRVDPWRYSADNIPVHLCSHVVLPVVGLGDFFSDLQNYDSLSLPPKPFHLDDFLRLRRITPRLRLLMSVGTFHNASAYFYAVAMSRDRTAGFARNLLRWLLANHLDGILLNGMFPAPVKARNSIVRLLKRISTLFRHRELAVVLPPQAELLKRPLGGRKVARFLDYAVMPPLWTPQHEQALAGIFLSGLPFKRLVVSVLFRGAPYSPTEGRKGASQPLPYYEVCQRKMNDSSLRDVNTTEPPDSPSRFLFDDPEPLAAQVTRLLQRNVAGFFVWDISLDDIVGVCGRRHVLLETIYNVSLMARTIPADVNL